ncbi:hypothetical protein ACQ4N7_16110 [Nodosilinea sp. AN01ver1]|uniref:hypothetical protein n=1 Tax=Nodosilinea sp. AN01ver1 TaxID=3423362 RepID=UPI003D31F26E
MKTPTLDQQFLSHLSLKQKRQVWKYYLLITHPDMDPDRQIQQISQIWSLAEADDRLMEWLEFIDYFYADMDDDEDERAVDARRAYLSEYLAERVELSTVPTSSYLPRFFQCPQGKGYVAVPRNSREPYDFATFQQRRCKNCGCEFAQHVEIQPDASLPEA